ncbi:MAG: hypothetical protein N3A02_04770, partial [Rectinema sp.]|nr:hypothetical protein [Rectinema sp.]
MPQLVQMKTQNNQEKTFRCWSAACSTGEEAYSLAMTAHDFFGAHSGWTIQIIATDINQESIEFAQRAVYGDWSFRGVPQEVIPRYFTLTTASPAVERIPGLPRHQHYRVADTIRTLVEFGELNLNASSWEGSPVEHLRFDLIFCRNVLLYFLQDQIPALAQRLAEKLEPHGMLIVGPSETWLMNNTCFTPVLIEGATIFALQSSQPADTRAPKTPSSMVPPAAHPLPAPKSAARAVPSSKSSAASRPTAAPHQRAKKSATVSIPLPVEREITLKEEKLTEARTHADSGRYRDAIEILDYLIEKDKTDSELYYLRAIANAGLHQHESASSDLRN